MIGVWASAIEETTQCSQVISGSYRQYWPDELLHAVNASALNALLNSFFVFGGDQDGSYKTS